MFSKQVGYLKAESHVIKVVYHNCLDGIFLVLITTVIKTFKFKNAILDIALWARLI